MFGNPRPYGRQVELSVFMLFRCRYKLLATYFELAIAHIKNKNVNCSPFHTGLRTSFCPAVPYTGRRDKIHLPIT